MKRESNGSEMVLNSICLRATGVEGDNAWRYNIEGCLVWVLASSQMRSQLYDNVNISYT